MQRPPYYVSTPLTAKATEEAAAKEAEVKAAEAKAPEEKAAKAALPAGR